MESGLILDSLVARLARRPQLAGLAAIFIHAFGPLAFFSAQALYLGQPVLGAFVSADEVGALAQLLEDPAKVRKLADRLERLGK